MSIEKKVIKSRSNVRIAVCDDERKQFPLIESALYNYGKHCGEEQYVEFFDNPIALLDYLEKSPKFDVLFLDVFMPGILGIDVAKEVRKRNSNIEIVFLTTSTDYAVEAFSVRATHYIVKPFLQEQIFDAMERVMSKLNNKIKTIELKLRNGEIRIVAPNEIMYVESYMHSQNVYFVNGGFVEARQTLMDIFNILSDIEKDQFIIPYKGFIVNQNSIRGIEKDKIILKNGHHIPIVKRKFNTIKEGYLDFIFKKEI